MEGRSRFIFKSVLILDFNPAQVKSLSEHVVVQCFGKYVRSFAESNSSNKIHLPASLKLTNQHISSHFVFSHTKTKLWNWHVLIFPGYVPDYSLVVT